MGDEPIYRETTGEDWTFPKTREPLVWAEWGIEGPASVKVPTDPGHPFWTGLSDRIPTHGLHGDPEVVEFTITTKRNPPRGLAREWSRAGWVLQLCLADIPLPRVAWYWHDEVRGAFAFKFGTRYADGIVVLDTPPFRPPRWAEKLCDRLAR